MTSAEVRVDGEVVGQVGVGLVALVGVHRDDSFAQAVKLADRIAGIRIFNDGDGKMNLALPEGGSVLAISNFTVYGDALKSRRPSFVSAASFEEGKRLFDAFVARLSELDVPVATGVFGADMQVSLTNDGPVTLVLDVE